MTLLQEQAVQMIRGLSDENVVFLIEVIERLMPAKAQKKFKYPSDVSAKEKIEAFRRLDIARSEITSYLPEDFDPEKELEEARRERYGNID